MSDKSLRYLLFGQDVSAGKTIEAVGTKGEKTAHLLGGAFSKMSSTIGGEFGDVLGRIGEGLDKMSEGGKSAKIIATGGAITGLGMALQGIASGDQQAKDQLNASIEATGNAASSYAEEIEGTIKKQENFGHSAADTQGALQKLTSATNDPAKALENMGVVADLAAAKHISLSDSASLVAKILNGGGGKALKEYGITMGKGKDATKNGTDAIDALGKKLSGQANASVDNFGAKVNIVKTKLGDFTAEIGGKLGPALTVIGPAIAGVGAAMEILAARQAASALAAEAQAVAVATETVTTEGATVAQDGLNASLLANPIGLVVLAILALVAIFVVAYNKVGWFHTAVNAAFHGITTAFGWVWDKAKAVFGWLAGQWPRISTILSAPVKIGIAVITGLWNGLTGIFSTVVGKIGGAIGVVKDILIAPFKFAFNKIADLWNNTIGRIGFDVPSFMGMGGFSFHMPQIPHLALGGITNGPTLALIGDNPGGREMVTPLPPGGMGGMSSGLTVNVTVQGIYAGDKMALAQTVRQALVELKSRQLAGGNLGLA